MLLQLRCTKESWMIFVPKDDAYDPFSVFYFSVVFYDFQLREH